MNKTASINDVEEIVDGHAKMSPQQARIEVHKVCRK
jgi:hypothetical protein